jgi:hypothetical protein
LGYLATALFAGAKDKLDFLFKTIGLGGKKGCGLWKRKHEDLKCKKKTFEDIFLTQDHSNLSLKSTQK